jgi:WD40 repeat protein
VATYQSYRARLAAAVAALSQHDVVDAARQLDAAPQALRDWEWRHLHTRLDDSTRVFPATAGASHFLISGPKGTRIARWTPATLHLSDLEGNEVLARSFRPETHLLYHPPILTKHGLRLWARDETRVAGTPGPAQPVKDATDVLVLLDDEGRVQTRLKGPEGTQDYLTAVSPDGARVAVIWRGAGGAAAVFTLYDSDSGKPVATAARDMDFTWAWAFSPDGTRIATADEDGQTRLWDTSTGAMTRKYRGHTRKVLSVAFRPDGRRLVTGSADGTVRQWDSTTGQEVESPYERHSGEVVTVAYSPDGLRVASGGTDRTVRVWEAANRRDIAVLNGHTGVVGDLAFTADGQRLASASQLLTEPYAVDGSVRIWEIGRRASTSVLYGHTSYIYPVAYSPDGQWIASGGWDNKVLLWDAVSGENCATLPRPGTVVALAFSPDSSWLVSNSGDWLDVWNVATTKREKRIKGRGSSIRAIAVSPDGSRIATADWVGNATISHVATGAEVYSFQRARVSTEGTGLAYSPDGRWLAMIGEDHTQIDICDSQTFHRSAQLTGHTGVVNSVAFSGNGLLLTSASTDRTVRVWDVAAVKCVAVLTGHTDEVFSAVFHPDGKRLASAGRDRAVWLWDLATGQEVARLEGHTNYVFSLAFSPDGRSLASGSGDGTVRIWDTESPALRHQARRDAEALRPEAGRLVARLFAELREPDQVAARLRSDQSLSEPLRRAAMREVMRRAQHAIP